MQSCLKQLCATEGLNLEMLCIDIKRKPWIDLSKSKERDKLWEQIKQEKFDAILVSPPCSTFSRACWAPRPIRSYKSPKGLATLTIFADFTWEVLTLASATHISFVLLEQPEDLGAMAYGPHAGERPASRWQWPAFADITAKPDWKAFAFPQGNFGAGCPKPTRLLVFAIEVASDFPPFAIRAPLPSIIKDFTWALCL